MDDCLPTAASIKQIFESAGFHTISSDIILQQIALDFAAYTEKVAAGADSVLARLTDEDFQAGLAAMRAHATTAGDNPVSEPIDVFVFR